MAIDTTLTEMGLCQILYGSDDLGATIDSVKFKIEDESFDTKTNQTGSTPCKGYITGRNVSCEFTLAEATMSNLAMALGTTVGTGGAGGKKVVITTPMGDQLNNGTALTLVKYVNGVPSSDEQDKLKIHDAGIKSQVEIVLGAGEQIGYHVVVQGYNDSSNELATIGDAT